jgi:hypothetical protein
LSALVAEFASEKEVESGSNGSYGGELANLIETRRDCRSQQIRSELKLQTQREEPTETNPDGAECRRVSIAYGSTAEPYEAEPGAGEDDNGANRLNEAYEKSHSCAQPALSENRLHAPRLPVQEPFRWNRQPVPHRA